MKILLVAPEYPPYGSGIANVVYVLRGLMLKKGIKVDVLSRGSAGVNITNAVNSLPGLAGLLPFWQKAADHIARIANDYDVVWLHSPLLMSTKKLCYTKKVLISFHTTYYGFYRACEAHGINHLLPYYYFATKLEHRFFRGLSHNDNVIVTAVSPAVAEEVRRNGLSLFPHVVAHGVEMKCHMLLDKCRSRLLIQQRFLPQLSENDRILLYIGRITEVKQPLLLVDLFKAISSLKPNIHLVIVGSGNLFIKLRKKANCLFNVHLLGHISHERVPTFLSAADAFISLPCYEGLPLTVLEAASFNLPLILSNIAAHKWIIASKVGRGILVDSYNPNFTETLNFLNNIEKEGAVPNPPVKKPFTWENIAEQYLTLLNTF